MQHAHAHYGMQYARCQVLSLLHICLMYMADDFLMNPSLHKNIGRENFPVRYLFGFYKGMKVIVALL